MNPVQMWKLWRTWVNLQKVEKEKISMDKKIQQYAPLIVTIISTLGIPAIAQDWVQHNPVVFAALAALAQILHAVMPSLFSEPTDNKTAGSGNIAPVVLLLVLFGSVAAMGQRVTYPAVAAPQVAQPVVNGSPYVTFAVSSEATGVYEGGAWYVGNSTAETLDVYQFGANDQHTLSLLGREDTNTGLGYTAYTGGLRVTPSIVGLLSKTNLPTDTISVHADAAVGNTVWNMAKGKDSFTTFLGGGVSVKVTTNLAAQVFNVSWLHHNGQNSAVISAGFRYFFN